MSRSPIVICDYGEERSGIPDRLVELGCTVELVRLPAADYLLSAAQAVERKSSADFAESVRSGRLLAQLQSASAYYPLTALLTEGSAWEGDRHLKTPMVARVHQWISHHPKLGYAHSPSPAYTPNLLAEWARAEQFERHAAPPVVPKAIPNARSPADVIRALPGVGAAGAKKLLDAFGSLHGVALADEESLLGVLGPKRGSNVFAFLRGEPAAQTASVQRRRR